MSVDPIIDNDDDDEVLDVLDVSDIFVGISYCLNAN